MLVRVTVLVVAAMVGEPELRWEAPPPSPARVYGCTWPGGPPYLWETDEGTLTAPEVVPRIRAWLEDLDCENETAPIVALLDGARLIDHHIVYSDAAVASARADLAEHAPACAASWQRSELLDPFVARDACPWHRSKPLVPFGGDWAEYAVVWSLQRRVAELVLVDDTGDERQERAAETLQDLLEWFTGFSDIQHDIGLAGARYEGWLVRLDEWRARWTPPRVARVAGRIDVCTLDDRFVSDPEEGEYELRTEHDRQLQYELDELIAFHEYRSFIHRSLASVSIEAKPERTSSRCDAACRSAWADVALAYAIEADRLCEDVTTP